MPGEEDRWAPLADRFVDGHYGTLRGRVRTHVIDRHLRAHLVAPPARIVDVGGGAGHQSLPLARDGYDVTIVDPSAAMLERAMQLIASEPPGVVGRIDLVEASAEDASSVLGEGEFDAVLCHGVIMYVEEPAPFVAALARLARPGAVVSVLAKNAANLAVRPALAGDWKAALAAFETERQINGLGVDTRGDSIEGLTSMLSDVGVESVAWYGVRLFTDGWTREMVPTDDDAEVFAVELEASRRDPYRQMSRLFHLVGRKTS
jgi:S-adenosylmethionine-dependent methyltransferase